jgi:hypothetical protein
MADYKGIKGFKVQYLSADPSNPIIGQTWYNDTSKDLKYTGVTATGTWASGGNLPSARHGARGAGAAPVDASLAFGGLTTTVIASTEEYNGTSWSPGGNLSTARYRMGGAGTQTAGLGFGGNPGSPPLYSNATEEYDGICLDSRWNYGNS